MQISFPLNGNLNPASMAHLIKLTNPFAVTISREFAENPLRAMKKRQSWGQGRRSELLEACFGELEKVWEENGCLSSPMNDRESVASYLLYMENPVRPEARQDWDNICWAFPDEIIASVMKVSRQAVGQQRKKRESESEFANFEAMNKMMLEDAALFLMVPPLRVMDIENMGVSRLLDAISDLPDIPAEKMDVILDRQQKQWGIGNIGAIWYAATKKGLSVSEAIQLFLTILPEIDHNLEWERETGIPSGIIRNIRGISPEMADARLAHLPDRGVNVGTDAVYRVARRKGVSFPQAVRLLYYAFRPDGCYLSENGR